jgi:hypothetical protein
MLWLCSSPAILSCGDGRRLPSGLKGFIVGITARENTAVGTGHYR